MKSIIQSYEEQLRISGIDVDKFIGCNDDEFSILKQCQCIEHLPSFYVEFMERFGGNINQIVHHEWEMGFEETIHLKQFAIDDFKASSDIIVPDDAFVFAQITQGVGVYYYFLTSDKKENLPVYRMMYDTEEVKQIYSSLAEFYNVFIQSICERLQ